MTTLKKALKQKVQEWEAAIAKQKSVIEEFKKKTNFSENDVDVVLRYTALVNRYTAELKIMEKWLDELKEISK